MSHVKAEVDSWATRSARSTSCREDFSSASDLLAASSLAVKAT
jgi:hypothetical protein